MTDYTELVKALRGKFIAYDVTGNHNSAQLYKDAADAIEALEKQIDSIENEKTNLEADIINLEIAIDKANTQLPKRGKWIVREVDIPGEIHPVAFRCMCSMCRNEYVFPRIPRYCPDCGSMNTAKMEVQDG